MASASSLRRLCDDAGKARGSVRKAEEGRTEGGGFYSGANGSKEIKEHSLCEKLLRRNIFSLKRGASLEMKRDSGTRREHEKERERES